MIDDLKDHEPYSLLHFAQKQVAIIESKDVKSRCQATVIPSNCQVEHKTRTTDSFITPKHQSSSNESTSNKTSQARSFCFTFNNYDDDIIAHFMDMHYSQTPKLSYICLGFEVGKKGTPHIQGYMYIPTKIRFNTLLKLCPHGTHLEIAIAKDPKYAYEYCFKDGDFYEMGERPMKNGVKKSENVGKQVLESISNGMSIDEAYLEYPQYMMLHGAKVETYFDRIRPAQETEFFVIEPVIDAVDEIHNYFDTLPDLAVVTDLSELHVLKSYKNIIYIPNLTGMYDHVKHNLWARKLAPITYKHGYQTIIVKCEKFIITTNTIENYGYFQTIPKLGQKEVKEDALIGLEPVKDKLSEASRRKTAADINLKKVLREINLEKRRQLIKETKGQV